MELMRLNKTKIDELTGSLNSHSLLVTNTIQNKNDLKTFMEHHVFAVWDFMSLLKDVQNAIVPSGSPWVPNKGNRSDVARMINEIVLCEESDVDMSGGSISHFDMYIQSMLEVGSDVKSINSFLEAFSKGSPHSFTLATEPARRFMETTFDIIERGPHCSAAAFAYGRETIIPDMFQKLLNQLNISRLEAPKFHYYLQRHIEVDGDEHGPMSEYLVQFLCDDDPVKVYEAQRAAEDAIRARIRLFDDIESLL